MAGMVRAVTINIKPREIQNERCTCYGLWSLVIINPLVFIIFAFSFTRPKSPRDWRLFGAFSAFIVALFTEMYGFPLTIYLLSGWFASSYPGVDFLSHDAGHLLETLFGWRANPHFGPFHLFSTLFIVVGFIVLANAWKVLYAAQKSRTLATKRFLMSNMLVMRPIHRHSFPALAAGLKTVV